MIFYGLKSKEATASLNKCNFVVGKWPVKGSNTDIYDAALPLYYYLLIVHISNVMMDLEGYLKFGLCFTLFQQGVYLVDKPILYHVFLFIYSFERCQFAQFDIVSCYITTSKGVETIFGFISNAF